MNSTIEKEWADLDIGKVDFDARPCRWTWCMGGHPLKSGEYAICFLPENNEEEIRYKLPKCLNDMIGLNIKFAREECKSEMRSALGL